MERIAEKILDKIRSCPQNGQAYEDLYHVGREVLAVNQEEGVRLLTELAGLCERAITTITEAQPSRKMYELHKKVLLAAAPYDFESYLLYIEWNREPEKKFYPPRRRVLKQVVRALQELADDKLDLLAISLPPGTGKTTLAIFFITWLAGKYPNQPILTGSHSNSFVRGVYDECLRILGTQEFAQRRGKDAPPTEQTPEYLWHDVFPDINVTGTNAKDCRIDLDQRQRFETLEFTSVGSSNAGLYRAATLLYCDDLVSGIEEALSKERLDKLWETYTTDLRQRKIGDRCKELHIATRWSVHDVIGRLECEYGNSERAKFIAVPALDENNRSNFDYAYGVGFSTGFYHQQRAIMDDVSWRALYMNQPIEREGLVYHPDELRRYYKLPEGEPDAVIAICDTKDTGNDYCFLPVGFVYGEDHYIVDCVCNNGLPDIVDAQLIEILLRYKVKACRFESNSAGGRVAKDIQRAVRERGGSTDISTKFTTANKETKIIVNSPWVKKHCLFRDTSLCLKRDDYGKMMDMLCSYTMAGKNKHDDVPDGMAQYAEFAQALSGDKVEIFHRPW